MKKNIFLMLSLGFVLGVNIYLRSFTINFPQLKIQAKGIIENTIRQALINEVYRKFPQFYPSARDQIVKSRVAEYKRQNKKEIKKQVQELYLKLKDRYQDDYGQTYLMELDCWHWARYVDNVVRLGHSGDELIYGRHWDILMLAPMGSFLHWEQFLYYLSAFLYKVFCIFKPVSLFTFLFYLPLFFATVFIILLYLFAFRCGRYVGAVISCLFVGMAPILLHRSSAGWFDTDILNLLFPLLVTWTYVMSCKSPSFRNRLFWICFSSFWIGLFCFTWTHWWFVFLIVIIYEFLFLGYITLTGFYFKKWNMDLLRQHILSLLLFVILSFLWILILAGTQPLIILYNQVRQALTLNRPLMISIWPNVYATVGELRRLSPPEMVRSVGSMWLFAPSVLCLLILSIRALFFGQKYSDFKRTSVIILAVWFISMLFATYRGVRFIVFLLIPLGISLGWAINELYEYFKEKNNVKAAAFVVITFVALSAVSIQRGYNTAKGLFPLIDDTWYKVLNIVKEKTSQDTIINSWWDFGDWFKVIARRRVIFDGQSQHTPQAYWMAKALLTNNEDEAIGILRMLNNGGNKAFEIMNERLKEPLLSVLLLDYVVSLAPDKAKETLLKFLPEAVTWEVMKLLFYKPASAVFVVDYTMPLKIGAISYLGSWNFSKVYIAQNFNKTEKDKIIDYLKNVGRDDKQMHRFYQEVFLITTRNLDDWLSDRYQFYSGLYNGRQDEGGVIVFDNGFVYNPEDKTVKSNAGQVPRSLFVFTEDNFTETVYPNANVVFSILVFKTESGYKSVLLDRELGPSMFTRLYFLNGKGLRHFMPFIDVESTNNYIRVFNIAW